MNWRFLRGFDLNPSHWLMAGLRAAGKALLRLWGRDVMLYVGGVSFFALLAVFPGLVILIGLYTLLSTPEQAALQAEALAHLMPGAAETLFTEELTRLATAPRPAASMQSIIALVIGAYAAFRGFKALLAGLSFIHDEDRPHGFLKFNLLALLVALSAFALTGVVSGVFLIFRLFARALDVKPLAGAGWISSDWTWTAVAMTVGLTLVYRYAMSRDRVIWRASILGGVAATIMFMAASWASAVYVEQIIELGATYGSIVSVIILLIWLSWNVNAVFYGGALATEIELMLHERRAPVITPEMREEALETVAAEAEAEAEAARASAGQ